MPGDDPRREGVKKQVTEVAIKYSVMSEYTSFVAVDQKRVVNPDGTYKTVDVPVTLPEGVDPALGGGGTGEGTIGLGNTGLIGRGGGGGGSSGYGRGSGAGFGGRGKRMPKVRQSKAKVQGALDSDIIRRIVRSHINEVRSCYNAELSKDPNLGGNVVVEFIIAGTGKISSAKVQTHLTKNKAVGDCIAKAVKRWKFPKPQGGGNVIVTYPFNLSPG